MGLPLHHGQLAEHSDLSSDVPPLSTTQRSVLDVVSHWASSRELASLPRRARAPPRLWPSSRAPSCQLHRQHTRTSPVLSRPKRSLPMFSEICESPEQTHVWLVFVKRSRTRRPPRLPSRRSKCLRSASSFTFILEYSYIIFCFSS